MKHRPENTLTLLDIIEQSIKNHPKIKKTSYDGDNSDGELIITTKDGSEFVISSNSIHKTI